MTEASLKTCMRHEQSLMKDWNIYKYFNNMIFLRNTSLRFSQVYSAIFLNPLRTPLPFSTGCYYLFQHKYWDYSKRPSFPNMSILFALIAAAHKRCPLQTRLRWLEIVISNKSQASHQQDFRLSSKLKYLSETNIH